MRLRQERASSTGRSGKPGGEAGRVCSAARPSFDPSSHSSERLCYPLQAPLSSLMKRVPEPVSKGSYGGGVCVQIRHRAWYVGNT